MTRVATYLAKEGMVLRSGGADGADTAFERGADQGAGGKEIFLPWRGFNDHPSRLYQIPRKAYALVDQYHVGAPRMKQSVRKLMARNCQQILGQHLDDHARFVICWTPGGLGGGGTGFGLKLAHIFGIDHFDIGSYQEQELDAVRYDLYRFIEKHRP